MKLLLVSFIADARWTGMGHWTYAVKEALERRGIEVDAWFENRFPRTRRLGRFAILAFPVVLALALIARRKQYDVVVLHEPVGFWYGLARRLIPGLPPLVAMCHNVERHYYETMSRFDRMGLARMDPLTRVRAPLLRHWQSNGTIRLADAVVCLSSTDRDYITGRLQVPARRVTVMVNGVAAEAFVDRRPQDRHVVWVGGWLDVKGSRILPALWNAARRALPSATLHLVGTGRPAPEVLADFDESDRDSITVTPRIERAEQMREMYASGDAYLLSSLSEGSPLSLMEAMAAGLPVVASRVGGVPDIVTADVHAILFDPAKPAEGGQALAALLSDPPRAARLGNAARARARELTWDAAAGTLLDVARSVR